VAAPSWLAGAFAAVMIAIALYSAGRLAASRLRQRETEFDADAVHIVMGVAMAGMLVPRLSPLPDSAWEAVFAIAAAWFAWQAIRTPRPAARADWRCPHPVPHLVECMAMIYMLLPAAPGSRPAGQEGGMPMPGVGGSPGAAVRFPALAVVLALFMLGYVVWAADQLTSLAQRRTAVTARTGAGYPPAPPGALTTESTLSTAGTPGAARAPSTPGAAGTHPASPAGRPMLAPRLAACAKIAMSITMGYMLILML
jgi:hypothetical protein